MSTPVTTSNRQFRFPHGDVVATRAALAVLKSFGYSALPYLIRHLQGDWGDLCAEDRNANESALEHGGRLFSSYDLSNIEGPATGRRPRLWIVTEHDRSATTLLLPEDY